MIERATRLAPFGAADIRIASEIYRRKYARAAEWGTVELSGATFRLDLREWPQAQAFLLGRYEPEIVRYAVERLPPGGVMVDGGAHVGLISLQVATRRPDIRVFAFEPHPVVAERFRENLRTNGLPSVTFEQLALSSTEGDIPFDLDTHSAHSAGNTSAVPTVRLDAYLETAGVEKLDLLKLDVEGHEFQALQGTSRLLDDGRVGSVIVEALEAHGDISRPASWLEERGLIRVALPDLRPRAIRRLRQVQHSNAAFERP